MIDGLKPYPKYKDSGVPWLGEVPEHWGVRRLGSITEILNGATPSSSVPEFWDGDIVWVTPDDLGKLKTKYIADSSRHITREGYHACGTTFAPAGSIVLSTRAPIGHLGILQVEACANQGCKILIPQVATASAYLYHVLFTAQPNLEVLGQGSTFLELSRSKLKAFPVSLPPLPEQTAIVRFLDWADHRIRQVIRARRRRIKLLEEYKQALINQGVSGKIDVRTGKPYPKYKDSCVPLLGEVPEHWKTMPIKRAFISMDYGISESGSDSGTIRLLTMGHLKNGRVIIPDSGGVDSVDPHLLLSPGDLLFNRTNSAELVAKVALFDGHETPVTFASYLVRMRPTKENEPQFLNLVLNDASILSVARREAIPSLHQSNLNPKRYGRLRIALPPKVEQEAILQYLQEETQKIDTAISATRREIDLLEEFRTRLIADVVTGKLDVREPAAKLPNKAPWEETLEGDEPGSAMGDSVLSGKHVDRTQEEINGG